MTSSMKRLLCRLGTTCLMAGFLFPVASSNFGAAGMSPLLAGGPAMAASFVALDVRGEQTFTFQDHRPIRGGRFAQDEFRAWFIDAFRRAVTARRATGSQSWDGAWLVEVRDETSGRSVVRVRVEGDELPDSRVLYVYSLFLTCPDASRPLEYRVLIGRDAYQRLVLGEREFAEEYLYRARRALASECGYRSSTYGQDFVRMVQVTDWRYELTRLGEGAPRRHGGRRDL